MNLEIVTKPNKVLTTLIRDMNVKDIHSSKIQELVMDMRDTLENAKNGVALAAPQVNSLERMFIISPNIFDMEEYLELDIQTVFINPRIIWCSNDQKKMEEGCLSIPGITGYVKRSTRATVEALDEAGNTFQLKGTGLLAQIFQHEIDHLDGILFDTKATDLKDNNKEE